MPTVGELVQSVAGRLEAAGIAESRLEARLLLADAAGWALEKIIAERDAALESGVAARRASRCHTSWAGANSGASGSWSRRMY
jgi:hypothetical protein